MTQGSLRKKLEEQKQTSIKKGKKNIFLPSAT